jgi:hypothetical protein
LKRQSSHYGRQFSHLLDSKSHVCPIGHSSQRGGLSNLLAE